ncbi:OLC1v1007366C4 [Oldenlandia corymbosa var. corymbosa]|uniref:OLC1v1007366C4 n=1 Tax=Oldenlandia corymbosa var. corymbosa TaxID=529605 RepID=A0AAV1DLF9_OLDCO|nr:OLC1v1007366C4 [Oldenlandia corymbosa var. corymbosa]
MAEQPLFSPIHKDNSTKLFSMQAFLQTPLRLKNLFLDLGATYTWFDCSNYTSSTYQNIHYDTTVCLQLDTLISGNCFEPPSPTCFNDSCECFPENSVTRQVDIGDILLDTLALPKTDGKNPGKLALIPEFEFSCAKPKLLAGLPAGVNGLAALGRFNFSFPAQISKAFSSPFVFAICAPSTPSANGVAVFNSFGPYFFLPGIDVSKLLTYTPLLLKPFGDTVIGYNRPSDEYFVGVTGIRVNGKPIPINQTLLGINQTTGLGGTKISTSTPYTMLQTSIFKTFTAAFKAAANALHLKRKGFGGVAAGRASLRSDKRKRGMSVTEAANLAKKAPCYAADSAPMHGDVVTVYYLGSEGCKKLLEDDMEAWLQENTKGSRRRFEVIGPGW